MKTKNHLPSVNSYYTSTSCGIKSWQIFTVWRRHVDQRCFTDRWILSDRCLDHIYFGAIRIFPMQVSCFRMAKQNCWHLVGVCFCVMEIKFWVQSEAVIITVYLATCGNNSEFTEFFSRIIPYSSHQDNLKSSWNFEKAKHHKKILTSELSFFVLYIKILTRNCSDYGPYQPLSYHHSTNYERCIANVF